MAYFTGEFYVGDWTAFSLSNGWTSRTGGVYPPTSYRITGPTVSLRGEITPPGILAGNTTLATLPGALAPPYSYVFACCGLTIGGIALAGNIRINTDGTVVLEGVTSLASISLDDIRYTVLA